MRRRGSEMDLIVYVRDFAEAFASTKVARGDETSRSTSSTRAIIARSIIRDELPRFIVDKHSVANANFSLARSTRDVPFNREAD